MKKIAFIALIMLGLAFVLRAQNYYAGGCGIASVNGAFIPSSANNWTNKFNWLMTSNSTGFTLSAPGFSGIDTNKLVATGGSVSQGVLAWSGSAFTNGGTMQVQICTGSFAGLWGFITVGFPSMPYTVSANLITNTWSPGYSGFLNGIGLVTTYFVVTNSFTGTNVLGPWLAVSNSIFTNPPPVFSLIPPLLELGALAVTNSLPAIGGNLTISARGISSATNESLLVAIISSGATNVVYQSPPTTASNLLVKLDGTLQVDGSNNLAGYFNFSAGGESSGQFFAATSFPGTNFSLSIGCDATLDTNLNLTAITITPKQPVNGAVPIYIWPPPPAFFSGTKTIYTVNSGNTAVITNTLAFTNGLLKSWLP